MDFQTYEKYLNAGSENKKKRTIFSSVFFRLGVKAWRHSLRSLVKTIIAITP